MSFEDQVVVVTGAGRGLGAAYTRLLAERGAHVVVHDAGVERDGGGGDLAIAAAVVTEIQAAGGSATAATQNLASREACDELVASVLAEHGRIDALIHSAGIVRYKTIAETTDDEWVIQRRVNIDAPFWLCRAVWPLMERAGYGRIVLTVSGYGLRAFDASDVTAYGVGKGAQFGLMNGLAGEGAGKGILVNAISPVAATLVFRAEIGRDEYPPASVAPAALILASPACPWTGKVVVAAGGRFRVDAMETCMEVDFDEVPSPETLLEQLTT